jgi:cysteine desulfurase
VTAPSVEPVYLDWNATAPPLEAATEAMCEARGAAWGNPMSVHRVGRSARAVLEQARERLAKALGLAARGIIFTSGGTEANNWALAAAQRIVTSRLEHPSVTKTAEHREQAGASLSWLEVRREGVVSLDSLDDALSREHGATMALMAVNHETGVIQPVAEASERVRRSAGRLHVDAVQWCGKAPLDELGHWDTLSIAAHKLGGPRGIGALVFRGTAPGRWLQGGAQERGLRAGTPDPILALGFAVAVEHAVAHLAEYQKLAALRDRLERELLRFGVVNGTAPRLGHVSNVSFAGRGGAELVAALDLHGVCVSSGSACSAGTTEPSEVVAAMHGRERARSAVRFSLGLGTTEADVDRTIKALEVVCADAGHASRTTPGQPPPRR